MDHIPRFFHDDLSVRKEQYVVTEYLPKGVTHTFITNKTERNEHFRNYWKITIEDYSKSQYSQDGDFTHYDSNEETIVYKKKNETVLYSAPLNRFPKEWNEIYYKPLTVSVSDHKYCVIVADIIEGKVFEKYPHVIVLDAMKNVDIEISYGNKLISEKLMYVVWININRYDKNLGIYRYGKNKNVYAHKHNNEIEMKNK